MIILRPLLLALLACLISLAPCRADADLDAANSAYAGGNYDEAAALFQKIIAARGYSAPLCFDLANAEARAGRPGQAMLYYERARYLAPADKEIDHNLQLERKKVGLPPDPYRWWEIMLLSINWSVWMGCIAAGLILIFLPTPILRNICRLVLFIGIPLCLLLGFVEISTIGFNQRLEGVIVSPKAATVWVSPFDSSDTRGAIPEGELVTVEDRHDDYLWVAGRDNQFGWVRLNEVAPVVAGSF
jgi:tetratricopeptide (TPR) repeat protein